MSGLCCNDHVAMKQKEQYHSAWTMFSIILSKMNQGFFFLSDCTKCITTGGNIYDYTR